MIGQFARNKKKQKKKQCRSYHKTKRITGFQIRQFPGDSPEKRVLMIDNSGYLVNSEVRTLFGHKTRSVFLVPIPWRIVIGEMKLVYIASNGSLEHF